MNTLSGLALTGALLQAMLVSGLEASSSGGASVQAGGQWRFVDDEASSGSSADAHAGSGQPGGSGQSLSNGQGQSIGLYPSPPHFPPTFEGPRGFVRPSPPHFPPTFEGPRGFVRPSPPHFPPTFEGPRGFFGPSPLPFPITFEGPRGFVRPSLPQFPSYGGEPDLGLFWGGSGGENLPEIFSPYDIPLLFVPSFGGTWGHGQNGQQGPGGIGQPGNDQGSSGQHCSSGQGSEPTPPQELPPSSPGGYEQHDQDHDDQTYPSPGSQPGTSGSFAADVGGNSSQANEPTNPKQSSSSSISFRF